MRYLVPILIVFLAGIALFATSSTQAGNLTDLADLGQFLDDTVTVRAEEYRVPGTAFVLVEDGRIRFARGWGYADLSAEKPFDPATTVIRLGSVTKAFTATAILQLVESGKLRLEDAVDDLIDDVHPLGIWKEPIRVGNLLTHTSGLDTRFFDILGRDPGKFRPLDAYLRRSIPPRVGPPETIIHYNDFGAAFAGLVVERLRDKSYDRVVQTHVFDPLSMHNSRIVTTSSAEPGLATGYDWDGREYVALETTAFIPVPPAGAASSTPLDLARILAAWMGDGSFEGGRILQSETAKLMRTTRFTNHPEFPGVCPGFLEYHKNGRRLVGHGGGVLGHTTMAYFIPSENLGYVIMANGNEAFRYLSDIEETFLDWRFPHPAPTLPEDREPIDDAGAYTGRYRGNRWPRSTFDALLAVALPIIPEQRVRFRDNRLVLDEVHFWFVSRRETELIPDGPHSFTRKDGRGRVAFLLGDEGRARHMVFSRNPVAVFERIGPGDTAASHAMIILVFSIVWIWSLWSLLRGWRRGGIDTTELPRSLGISLGAMALLGLLSPAMPLAALFPREWTAPAHVFGPTPFMRVLLFVPRLFVISTAFFIVSAARFLVTTDEITPWRRAHLITAGFTAVIAARYFAAFNLLDVIP